MSDDQRVKIEELQPRPALSIRATIPIARLGETMGERIRLLGEFLREHDVRPAGPPFVRYHTFGDVDTDMEFGVPVAEPVTGAGPVAGGELPGGPAATTWHIGAHDRLGEAYGRIEAWRAQHGREPAGPGWEVYHWLDLGLSGEPAGPSEPSGWRTQLVQPIR